MCTQGCPSWTLAEQMQPLGMVPPWIRGSAIRIIYYHINNRLDRQTIRMVETLRQCSTNGIDTNLLFVILCRCRQENYKLIVILTIQPKDPPFRALSSLNFEATSLNFSPASSFAIASRHLLCFSHKICLTFTELDPPPFSLEAPFLSSFPPLSPPKSVRMGCFGWAGMSSLINCFEAKLESVEDLRRF